MIKVVINESINYSDPEMKKLRSAIKHIVVDNYNQFEELIDNILAGNEINYTKETRALKNILQRFQEYMDDDDIYDLAINIAYDNNMFESKPVNESSSDAYAKVQVGMQWVSDEFTKTCTKIKGNKCWITDNWMSLDSDEEHTSTAVYNISKGNNCDVLNDPDYPGEIGQLYVNSAINLDKFYPDYWDIVLGRD